MALILNDDEKMLLSSAQGFFADKAPVSAFRKLRDSRLINADTDHDAGHDTGGIDRALWSEMADMGYAGVLIGEEHGGVDMGFMAAGLIAEQMGRNLTASPFLSSSVLSATALRASGEGALQASLLKKIANGTAIMALATDENSKHNPSHVETRAERAGNGFRLNGQKQAVIDGHIADHIIIPAQTSPSKISLFVVDANASGLSCERTHMVDSRNAARLELSDVELTSDALIGEIDDGAQILGHALSAGRAMLAAELLGAGEQAFRLTVDYIKERKQFGRIIGEFQALQHRAAHLYSEIELCRSAVLAALTALDEKDAKADIYCAMAKAKLGQVAKLAALEGVQMHGGVGMTDEYDIGLFLKRIRVAQEMLGDGHYHMDQIAKSASY